MKLKEFTKQVNSEQAERDASGPLISDISVDKLVGEGLLALSREIRNLLTASAQGKLDPASARDLRDHLKLLFELKDREGNNLDGMSDAELRAKAKDALADDDK